MGSIRKLLRYLISAGVPHRQYNTLPEQYVSSVAQPDTTPADVAVIEFDDFGVLWDRRQLEAAVELISRRNTESEHGVFVLVYVHGWMNNADPSRKDNDLARFREAVRVRARGFRDAGPPAPDHYIGVYIGWRGMSSRIPIHKRLTFWNRRRAAEGLVSEDVRETFFRVSGAAKAKSKSKVVLSGHSMGGLVLEKSLGPAMTTLLLAIDPKGIPGLIDRMYLMNPASDALTLLQFLGLVKRLGVYVELRSDDGRVEEGHGPFTVSITSEADWVTKYVYSFGQNMGKIFAAFRRDHEPPRPSQRRLATSTQGHVQYLLSHRAYVKDNEVVIERIPGAYNDTPFWVISVSKEIGRDHGDIDNPRMEELIWKLNALNGLLDTESHLWLRARNLAPS